MLIQIEDEQFQPLQKKFRSSVSPMFLSRDQEGTYVTYFCRYCKDDDKVFRKFVRLGPEEFYKLLECIEADIHVEPTNRYPNPINAEHQLALTLRYH